MRSGRNFTNNYTGDLIMGHGGGGGTASRFGACLVVFVGDAKCCGGGFV